MFANNELGTIRKEAVLAYFKMLSCQTPGQTKEVASPLWL